MARRSRRSTGAELWLRPTTTTDIAFKLTVRLAAGAESAVGLACRGDGLDALLEEGQDLELGRKVDRADGHVRGKVHDGGGEVEDRLDPCISEALADLLSRGRGGGDDTYRDAFL